MSTWVGDVLGGANNFALCWVSAVAGSRTFRVSCIHATPKLPSEHDTRSCWLARLHRWWPGDGLAGGQP